MNKNRADVDRIVHGCDAEAHWRLKADKVVPQS